MLRRMQSIGIELDSGGIPKMKPGNRLMVGVPGTTQRSNGESHGKLHASRLTMGMVKHVRFFASERHYEANPATVDCYLPFRLRPRRPDAAFLARPGANVDPDSQHRLG